MCARIEADPTTTVGGDDIAHTHTDTQHTHTQTHTHSRTHACAHARTHLLLAGGDDALDVGEGQQRDLGRLPAGRAGSR